MPRINLSKSSELRTLTVGNAVFIISPPQTQRANLLILVLLIILFYISLALGKQGIDNPWLATSTSYQEFILTQLRLPRTLVAIGAGAALALSGSLFQLITRNTLGSPDIIGVNAGATAGIAATLIIWPGTIPAPLGALLGASFAVLLVFSGNMPRSRNIQATKIIICGIAISALCMAFVNLALSNIRLEQMQQLASLLHGSLASKDWRDVGLIYGIVLLIPFILWLGRQLNYINLGYEIAHTFGVPVRSIQAISLILAVLLSSMAILVVGPVAFIALSAPQIARRLIRARGAALCCSALIGALLLLASDLITLLLPTSARLPVGVVTAGIGGIYLMYLLYAELRSTT